MATRKGDSEPAKFGSRGFIVGPVHANDPEPSQSLLDMHRKFSVQYTKNTNTAVYSTSDEPEQSRVLGLNARTTEELVEQARRQSEHRMSLKGARNPEK